MGRKLTGLSLIGLLVLGCGGPSNEEAKGAYLDAPSKPPVSESQAQADRGISPEVAQGMAEPGLGGKR